MPYREVKTIRDLIFYQYAKIITKSALGLDAKKKKLIRKKTLSLKLFCHQNVNKMIAILHTGSYMLNSIPAAPLSKDNRNPAGFLFYGGVAYAI